MRKDYIIEVEWDSDGETVDAPKAFLVSIDLPSRDDEGELLDMAIDEISDEFGWCVGSVRTYDLDFEDAPAQYNKDELPTVTELIANGEHCGWDITYGEW